MGEWVEPSGGVGMRVWAWPGVGAADGVAWELVGKCGPASQPAIALPNHGSGERLI